MLGSSKLTTLFGSVSPGVNTAGMDVLSAMLRSYAAEGIAVLFVDPATKIPLDPRPDTRKRKDQKQWEAEGNTGKAPAGFHLATSNATTLKSYLKHVRKTFDGAEAVSKEQSARRWGFTPLGFGLVPDKSRYVVVDCDTVEEGWAFRNFLMDHSQDANVAAHVDVIQPSVHTPGKVTGGTWHVAREAQVYDDYGVEVYIPPTYQNEGGSAKHIGGGHWYFPYPDEFSLPENVPAKIQIRYSCEDRSELLTAYREAKEAYAVDPHDDTLEAYNEAVARVQEVIARSRQEYEQENYSNEGEYAQFTIMLHSCYVIIPPSSRYEGHYRVGNGDYAWEPWLEEIIVGATPHTPVEDTPPALVTPPSQPSATPSRVEYAEDPVAEITADPESFALSFSEAIEHWAWTQPWESILRAEDGWVKQPFTDRCGCEIFTAPGIHASPKSVTAHIGSCALGCSDSGRLHIWTDNPPEEFREALAQGKRDFSKLSTLALVAYEGNIARALVGEGVEVPQLRDADLDDLDLIQLLQAQENRLLPLPTHSAQEEVRLIPFREAKLEEPPIYIVEDTLERDSFSTMIGAPGSGKSFVAISLAASLATGSKWLGKHCRKMNVCYFAGEGRPGVISRFRAWLDVRGRAEDELDDTLFIANYLPNLSLYTPADYNRLADTILITGSKFVIIDTWSRANAGSDENSAEVTSKTIATLNAMQRRCNCSVLVLHHTRKDSDVARGSSALLGAADTEILVKTLEADPDPTQNRKVREVSITKQKNTEPWEEPAYCIITKQGEDEKVYVDGFPETHYAPAALSDMDGNFEEGPETPFGLNYSLDSKKSALLEARADDVIEEIDVILREHVLGLSEARLITYIIDALEARTRRMYLRTARLERQITAMLQVAQKHRMVELSGSKYVSLAGRPTYADPQKVLKILAKKKDD